MNTYIELMYRDACNWKSFIDFVVEGEITECQIIPHLHDNDFMIPYDIGLPELELDASDPTTDHPWYTISLIEPTTDKPTIEITAQALRRNLENVKWDEHAAMERNGLL